jgi:hypothetical protein
MFAEKRSQDLSGVSKLQTVERRCQQLYVRYYQHWLAAKRLELSGSVGCLRKLPSRLLSVLVTNFDSPSLWAAVVENGDQVLVVKVRSRRFWIL